MTTFAYLPAPRTEFVELARTASGRLFKKQLLKFGAFAHPNIAGERLVVDRPLAESLVRNFKDGVCDIVQVPVVDDKNVHVEDPFRNIGEVIDLTVEDDGVYATIDVRKQQAAEEVGKTLLGVSAMMHLNYTDTRTGEKVGPTLLHAAVTNRPYITNLGPFEEIIAASADTLGDEVPVVFTESEETSMTKEEMIQALRDEHGIDVSELETRATAGVDDLVNAMSRVLAEAGIVRMSNTDDEDEVITVKDVAEAVIELSQEKVALEERVADLVAEASARFEQATVAEVDALVQAGRILPAQRDVMLRLARNDRETFAALVPESAIVSLSEDGVTVHERPANSSFEEEIARLSAKAEDLTGGKK